MFVFNVFGREDGAVDVSWEEPFAERHDLRVELEERVKSWFVAGNPFPDRPWQVRFEYVPGTEVGLGDEVARTVYRRLAGGLVLLWAAYVNGEERLNELHGRAERMLVDGIKKFVARELSSGQPRRMTPAWFVARTVSAQSGLGMSVAELGGDRPVLVRIPVLDQRDPFMSVWADELDARMAAGMHWNFRLASDALMQEQMDVIDAAQLRIGEIKRYAS